MPRLIVWECDCCGDAVAAEYMPPEWYTAFVPADGAQWRVVGCTAPCLAHALGHMLIRREKVTGGIEVARQS